ncbi:MAG: imidazole glycerol phosphate synthase subunit HisH [Pseudomonadota bacterium]
MSTGNVAIVDTGGANLASLGYALARLGASSTVTDDPHDIAAATHVILPGVGAAGDAMQRLNRTGLAELIPTLTQPVLGICLGMHLLAERSAEDDVRCLGVFDTAVERIVASNDRVVPHMGWNRTETTRHSRLLADMPDAPYHYYVHSYAIAADCTDCVATFDYDEPFAAVVERDNFAGTQFHPERSAHHGRALLANFLSNRMC